MIKDYVENLSSKQQSAQEYYKCFNYCAEEHVKSLKSKEKKKVKNITFIYHHSQDEKFATKKAIEKVNQTYDTEFVDLNHDDNILRLVDKKAFLSKHKNQSEIKNSAKQESKNKKNSFNNIFTIIQTIVAILALLCGGGVTYIKELDKSLTEEAKKIWYIVLTVILLIAVIVFAILLIVKFMKKKRTAVETSISLEDICIDELTASDFLFKSENVVYLIYQPINANENNAVWDIFKKYIEYLPEKVPFSCVVFSLRYLANNNTVHASEVFEDDFKAKKSELIELNQSVLVYGYYLKPLTSSQKLELMQELNLPSNRISPAYKSYGRDYLYDYKNSSSLTASEYERIIDNIYQSSNAEPLMNKTNFKFLITYISSSLTFLAAILVSKKSFSASDIEYILDQDSTKALMAQLNIDEEMHNNFINIIKDILSKWVEDLFSIADRYNKLLLPSESADNSDVEWRAYVLAIEQILRYLNKSGKMKLSRYEMLEYYLNTTLQHLFIWHKEEAVSNGGLLEKNFIENYLDIYKTILQLNVDIGAFVNNSYLLNNLRSMFERTRNTDFEKEFNSLYCAEEVKQAFEINAIVAPSIKFEMNPDIVVDFPPYVDTDFCCWFNDWLYNYLKNVAEISGQNIEISSAPIWFELFEVRGDINEYYTLLKTYNERILDIFKSLYVVCATACRRYKNSFGENFYLDGEDEEIISIHQKEVTVNDLTTVLVNTALGNNDRINVILGNKVSIDETLYCGLFNCDLFYMLHDLYVWRDKKNHNEKSGFSENLDNNIYKVIDYLVYIELFKYNRFNNVFDNLIRVIIHNNRKNIFIRYFLSIVNNVSVSEENKRTIINYLNQEEVKLKLINCEIKDIKILDMLFQSYCNFLWKELKTGDWWNEITSQNDEIVQCKNDIYNYYINFDENNDLADESSIIKLIDRIKKYPATICYLIFDKVAKANAIAYKYINKVAYKLSDAWYTHRLVPIIDSLAYVNESEKQQLVEKLTKAINEQKEKKYQSDLLGKYIWFFESYSEIIDAKHGDGYSVGRIGVLAMQLAVLKSMKVADFASHLSGDLNVILSYFVQVLDVLLCTRKFVGGHYNKDYEEGKAIEYTSFMSLDLILSDTIKSDKPCINDLYIEYVATIRKDNNLSSEETLNVRVKIIRDLIWVFRQYSNIFEVKLSAKQINLLTKLQERILSNK